MPSKKIKKQNKKFDEILLADLIEETEIQNLIKEAEKELYKNNFKESIIASAKAFEKASIGEIRKRPYVRRPSLFIRSDVERIGEKIGMRDAFGKLGRIFDHVKRSIEYLERQLNVISIGGDLRRYLRFKEKSPHIAVVLGGDLHVSIQPDWEPTRDDCVEVLDFVFSTLLRLQSVPLEEQL